MYFKKLKELSKQITKIDKDSLNLTQIVQEMLCASVMHNKVALNASYIL